MEVEYQALDPLRSCYNTPHHHYKPYKHPQTPSFEFKVIYIRLVTSPLEVQTAITLTFPPRDLHTCLQINGVKTNPGESTTRCLNKHREDMFLSESVYVNTDRIKFRGKYLGFEVNNEGCPTPIFKGVVRRKEDEGGEWVLECREGEGVTVGEGLVDVYCAGRSLGKVVLFNQVVELKGLKQMECFQTKDIDAKFTEEFDQHNSYDDQLDLNLSQSSEDEKEETLVEEGELSWFNAGVKLGIGLGVGMSLGVGVGLGLVIRTYKTTSRVLNKFIQ